MHIWKEKSQMTYHRYEYWSRDRQIFFVSLGNNIYIKMHTKANRNGNMFSYTHSYGMIS